MGTPLDYISGLGSAPMLLTHLRQEARERRQRRGLVAEITSLHETTGPLKDSETLLAEADIFERYGDVELANVLRAAVAKAS